ncbi:hypothetical protein [Bdellovibrio svalbardensis]|uniref:Cyanovirin-N domain-containing protein n=1 Tax=Bdellovibrio svalbardensis TaxID=2972972 RepID=A0ABT6DK20_9BACT|nr:hypothetical protein [Bdellovibrio svalbardensis]MDG0815448.1 hypothetical protein [Bdellovibrio svalbardensis]
MKSSLILNALVFLCLSSSTAFAIESGLYECTNGNNASICPQKVIVKRQEGRLASLKVYYSGYCNDQGPYYYSCNETVCGDGVIEFSKIEDSGYHWENRGYKFTCDFQKSSAAGR